MYFTDNLALVNHFDHWTDSVMHIIIFDITEDEQILLISLQYFCFIPHILRPLLLNLRVNKEFFRSTNAYWIYRKYEMTHKKFSSHLNHSKFSFSHRAF